CGTATSAEFVTTAYAASTSDESGAISAFSVSALSEESTSYGSIGGQIVESGGVEAGTVSASATVACVVSPEAERSNASQGYPPKGQGTSRQAFPSPRNVPRSYTPRWATAARKRSSCATIHAVR